MAKPILIIKIPVYQYNDMGEAEFNRFTSGLIEQFNDYHVLSYTSLVDEIEFNCYNDCSGLKDIDIKKLIEDLKNG